MKSVETLTDRRSDVPENGDVVIRCSGPEAEPSYLISSVAGPDRFRCANRAEAERMRRSCAAHVSVNVWVAKSPHGFALLARLRGYARHTPLHTGYKASALQSIDKRLARAAWRTP
jgi:hypothetical protein